MKNISVDLNSVKRCDHLAASSADSLITLLTMQYCIPETGADFGWIDNLGLQREMQAIFLGIRKKDAELKETTSKLPCGSQIHPKKVKGGESPGNNQGCSFIISY